jgi:hypothetical protein
MKRTGDNLMRSSVLLACLLLGTTAFAGSGFRTSVVEANPLAQHQTLQTAKSPLIDQVVPSIERQVRGQNHTSRRLTTMAIPSGCSSERSRLAVDRSRAEVLFELPANIAPPNNRAPPRLF